MPGDKFVSVNVAKERLWNAGFGRSNALRFLAVSKGVRKHDLEVVERAAGEIGAQWTSELINYLHISTAYRQLGKKPFSKLGQTRKHFRSKMIALLEAFTPHLAKLANSTLLQKKGYSIRLGQGEYPISFSISLEEGRSQIGRFNFDLFFNRQLKPSAVLGSFQGGHKAKVQEFKRRTHKSALDFFASSFRNAFRGQRQLLALNPRRHPYRVKPNLYPLANSMAYRGKLTQEEAKAYREYDAGLRKRTSKKLQAVIDKVKAERQRIVTETTGMHKAVYKKAGFKKSKSRLWRLQRKKKN